MSNPKNQTQMKKTRILFLLPVALLITSCGGDSGEGSTSSTPPKSMVEDEPQADPKGVGEVRHVDLNNPLNEDWIGAGQAIYDLKCSACHKLTGQRVVGPGWKGVTDRRTPEWIMNMTMNADVMLEKDPAAQELLKECLVRMPNQNLSHDDARHVLEFMMRNDDKS